MKKTVYYKGYEYDFPVVKFKFSYKNKEISYRIFLESFTDEEIKKQDYKIFDRVLNLTGLAFLPYLFNIEWFDEIVLEGVNLADKSRFFLEDSIFKGLGEFKYKNKLPLTLSTKIICDKVAKRDSFLLGAKNLGLVFAGGGKDSIVCGEILKSIKLPFYWFTLNLHGFRRSAIASSTNLEVEHIKWKKHKAIWKYKGHKPLNYALSFLSLLPTVINKNKYIVTSNEYSANFGNTQINGFNVNHQYSKSFEYERNFSDFIKENLFEDVHYFSILRPFYEIQIAKMFSRFKNYFGKFNSCNNTQQKGYWCSRCHKCAFIFLILSPYISREESIKIFGSNYLKNEIILNKIYDLVSGEMKPFECVGTIFENRLVLKLALERGVFNNIDRVILEKYKQVVKSIDIDKDTAKYLKGFQGEHIIPDELVKGIRNVTAKSLKD